MRDDAERSRWRFPSWPPSHCASLCEWPTCAMSHRASSHCAMSNIRRRRCRPFDRGGRRGRRHRRFQDHRSGRCARADRRVPSLSRRLRRRILHRHRRRVGQRGRGKQHRRAPHASIHHENVDGVCGRRRTRHGQDPGHGRPIWNSPRTAPRGWCSKATATCCWEPERPTRTTSTDVPDWARLPGGPHRRCGSVASPP